MSVSKGAFPWGGRGDRLVHDQHQDPYMKRCKLHEPSVCPTCGAVYHEGRWKWMDRPAGAHEVTCPACQRIHEGAEAGVLNFRGEFLKKHGKEIVNIARNEEKAEKGEHPLHRIIKVEEGEETVAITTTDIHLPKRIGEAVRHACKGELEVDFDQDGYYIRVNWHR